MIAIIIVCEKSLANLGKYLAIFSLEIGSVKACTKSIYVLDILYIYPYEEYKGMQIYSARQTVYLRYSQNNLVE